MRVEGTEPPADRLTEVGLRDTWGPEGETVALKVRVPEKPFVLVSVMEVVPDELGASVRDVGLGVIEKSGGGLTTKLPTMLEWKVQKYV